MLIEEICDGSRGYAIYKFINSRVCKHISFGWRILILNIIIAAFSREWEMEFWDKL